MVYFLVLWVGLVLSRTTQLEAKRNVAESKISAEKAAREAAETLHDQLADEKVKIPS